jgi:hypothetical protein
MDPPPAPGLDRYSSSLPKEEENSSVIRTILASSVVAAGLLLAGHNQPAEAGVPVPDAAQSSPAQQVAWVCGLSQCVWVQTYSGVVAPYAATWGPPVYPGCVWRRGFLGRWRMICP